MSNSIALIAAMKGHLGMAESLSTDVRLTRRDFKTILDSHEALQKQNAELVEVLKDITENISQEYETEYDGRMEVYCTSCGTRMTNGNECDPSCTWLKIDAAIEHAKAPS